jgi:uncharacterized protein YfaS (alpha-2-macroglobulin family)
MPRFLVVPLVFLLLLSCGRSDDAKDDFSSPIGLFVDQVSAYTAGVVSVASPIKLRLASSAGDSLAGTTVSKKIFSFSPDIEGTASWEDNRTVVFQPAQLLRNNQKYEVTANLKTVLPNLPKGKEEFRFVFQTLKQNYEVILAGIKLYDRNDLTRLKVEGQLQTADYAQPDKVKSILSATQNGKNLSLTWHDTGQSNIYQFVVENASRGDQAGQVTLSLDGESIGVEKTDKLQVPIPALSDYKVVSSRVVQGKENYVSVLFSDPLDQRQNLAGLVSLSNQSTNPRLVIDVNELKIYPTQTVTDAADLVINQAVRNSAGFKLKEDYATTIQFATLKPEVKLADGNDKAILPNSKGLRLTFQSTGLNAVDVSVVQVYEDNMLQYLQVNSFGESNELRRVAHPVARKTIPLNTSGVTNLNSWNDFTLNLEDLIKTQPGAMYQVRIGFRKAYSLYFCSDSETLEPLDDNDEDRWDAPAEGSYWDYSEDYYSEGYNWEERDNPCSSSYYGQRRSVTKMVFASDLGLIAKRRDNGDLYVFASNLVTTELQRGVDLEVYDYQQQLIAKGSTDGDGKARIKVDRTPFAIIARKGDQVGYLKLDDGSALSLSNFDITGTKIKDGLKGFIYGERGVWRPADTIHLAFVLERAGNDFPTDHPVSLELYNPMNQLAIRKINATPVGDIYRFDFVTDAEAPTGNWLAKVKAGGATFTKTVKIETIKPNRLKIDLRFAQDRFTSNSRNVSGDLNVRWLSGATASNLKAEYELMLTPVKTSFKAYPGYSFDDASKEYHPEREMVFEGRVNSEGYARVNIDLGDGQNAPGALNARLFGKVYEEGGDFSISNVTVPYYPYSSFVGIKAPDGDKRGILLTDEDHQIRIASVDADGNPVNRDGINITLYKLDWKWWWDNSWESLSNYVGSSYSHLVAQGVVNTRNGEGKWTLRINHPEWGRYYLRAEDPVSGHSAGQVVYIDWPGWAGKGKRGELDGASMLDFAVEKEEYNVGEKINLSIPSTAGNRILVSLESGSEILQTFWVEAKQDHTVVSFDATSEMAPNVYAHLTMIQPHAQANNDLPIRLYGVQSIPVVDPTTRLQPVIQMPKELRPEQQYTIKVSESRKRAMAYTIAVVDEGLLDITNFKTPDPWGSFYSREALGIKTWDVYDDVMGAMAGKMDHLLGIGGDEELQPKDQKEANRFKPVVKFLGPFYLKAGETNSHTIRMAQYIGSVKTMVVAAGNGAYGNAEAVTPVKQPLMVLATMPRVAGPGESIKLPVNVFALGEDMGDVSVTVDVTGTLGLSGGKTKTLSFPKSGDRIIYFDLKAKEATGPAKVKVTAKSGSLTANYDVDINVIPRNPMSSDVVEKVLEPNGSWSATYEPLGIPGENTGTIELSTLPPLNLEQRMDFLILYPHGCVEQTTSSVFAQLYLKNLLHLDAERQAQIQRNVEAGIKRLTSFQVPAGGFSYWPGEAYPSNWGTNYAGHFLIEAKKAGYAVSEAMLANWLNFQNQKAQAWGALSAEEDNDLIQAYRLYTLAEAGSPALGAMNRMREQTTVRAEARWRLASAYAVAGYAQQAEAIIEGLQTTIDTSANKYYYENTFGSATRDQAMILETLLDLKKQEAAFPILLSLAKSMGDKDRWMSTQTTAYSLIAISKYASAFGVEQQTNVSVSLNGSASKVAGSDFVNQVSVRKADQKSEIAITNNGGAPVFARLIRTGIPIEGSEEPASRNISFDVSYTDMEGNPVDVGNLPQGTNFKAVVTVKNPGLRGKYNELALTQLFPSGWEIVNTRLNDADVQKQAADYIDIRDDRVMHYFDLEPRNEVRFTVLLIAAYQGQYYLPSVKVEAMYDNSIFASRKGRWVSVVSQGN